ncbi:MAG: two-component system sensor histidine kinase NtrB [Candidatus Binatia bacterium]
MTKPYATSFTIRFNSFSETAAAAVVLTGAAVLFGWLFDNPTLKSLHPGLVSMKANDALAFMLAGSVLWLLREEPIADRQRRVSRVLAVAVAAIGVATLSEYAFGWSLGIDQLVFAETTGMVWTSHPGRMAPTSALNFLLLGIALHQLDVPRSQWRVEILTFAAIFVSFLALLGHLYALQLLHGTGYYTHMAFHSTATFLILAGGILFARPDRGIMSVISSETAGGAMARRLLPAAIVLPPVLAWASYQGARAGYYQAVFGLALLTLASIVAFGIVVFASARSLYRVDIERERAEAAAARSRERLRLMVDGVKDYAMFVLDPEGYIRSWNPGAERIIGYREEEIIGRHFSIFYSLEEVALGKPEQQLETAAAEGRVEHEGWRIRKDGSRFWANVVVTALRGPDGELRAFAKITRDMSERRRIEEQLQSANAELTHRERALSETLDDLKRTHEALKSAQLQVIQTEKMESVGRLAAGVAHEVKNPLAIIQSGIDYLAERSERGAVDTQVLGQMEHAIERASGIIGGLLDFSVPRDLELESEDLNGVIDQALKLVKHELDRARINVARELAADLPRIRLDKRKMEQVFLNVFLNSIQAMPEGGTLTVRSARRSTADLRPGPGSRGSRQLRAVTDVVVAEVEDTGSGVPDEVVRKVFEPFFTTKPTRQGTGLGLTVSKAIVEMHGGAIEIRNREGGGAKVTISLNRRGDREHAQEAITARR